MTTTIQRAFAGGEIAPVLYARADQIKYQYGLAACRNFIVRKEGGAQNRAGTEFIAEVKDSSVGARMWKFVFNDEQTYLLEWGDEYLRFCREGVQIEVSGVAAWLTATAYVVGDLRSNGGVNYYCQEAHTSGVFATDLAAEKWHALTGTIYEIPTPYATEDLDELQFVQSGDVVTIVHPSHAVRELVRSGHTAWTLTAVAFAPAITAPQNPVVIKGSTGTKTYEYQITAIKDETLEESLPSATATASTAGAPSVSAPHELSWDAVAGAVDYNVYRAVNGVFSYLGRASGTAYSDDGKMEPNTLDTPPIDRDPFDSVGNYPGVVGFFNQRQLYARTDNDIEKTWASRVGDYRNMSTRSPLVDDDALSWTLAMRQVNQIRHLIELDRLVILTTGGMVTVRGDQDGVLRPGAINARSQAGSHGADSIPPVVIGNQVVFVQKGGSVVRSLLYEFESDGYRGSDLTIFASHLFRGKTVVAMDYAETPDSIIWCVRSDGVLLGLTYLPEHEVWGWHRHDTGSNDAFEDLVVIPEDGEDAVYVLVKRFIDGATKRYIERLHSREIGDQAVDAFFVDSGLSYDGRNTTAKTMTLSGGTDWLYTEDLTLTASSAEFVAGDVGNAYLLRIIDDDPESETYGEVTARVICTIQTFTSDTVVTVRANKTVPAALRGVATAEWDRQVDELSGLDHLEGETVSILVDGHVHPQEVVSGGEITLDRPYGVIHVGIPIEADLETLPLANPQGQTIIDRRKLITKVTLLVENSRGIFIGPDGSNLVELPPEDSVDWDQPVELQTGPITLRIPGTWGKQGRVLIRQSDPIPLTVLAVAPAGAVAEGR